MPLSSRIAWSSVTYFIGSLFFTTAAFEQLRTARGEGAGVGAATIQFAGTLAFNVTTFAGMLERLDAHQAELLVWSPDAIGSICFLVSSVLAEIAIWGPLVPARRSATLNLIGSVAFGISAVAAYVVPNTDELLNASLATSMTLVGRALLLLGGAGAGQAAAVAASEARRGAGLRRAPSSLSRRRYRRRARLPPRPRPRRARDRPSRTSRSRR